MTAMGPLFDFYHDHPGVSPRDALAGVVVETNRRQQQMNQMAAMTNGQIQHGQRPGMNGPNQFQSPAMAHLGAPQMQGSPHLGGPVHTPSPAQNLNSGGIAMVHQMSQQGSNLSGSQGPSTNTSPNVTNKRRRASQIKMEEEGSSQDVNGSKVKPSPKLTGGGKRQKA